MTRALSEHFSDNSRGVRFPKDAWVEFRRVRDAVWWLEEQGIAVTIAGIVERIAVVAGDAGRPEWALTEDLVWLYLPWIKGAWSLDYSGGDGGDDDANSLLDFVSFTQDGEQSRVDDHSSLSAALATLTPIERAAVEDRHAGKTGPSTLAEKIALSKLRHPSRWKHFAEVL